MSPRAVWVCPDCAVKLQEPVIHACPHDRACVPGLAGGPSSASRDECDKCAGRVLVLDGNWLARASAVGKAAQTRDLSGWAKRRAQEEQDAVDAVNALVTQARPRAEPPETVEQKRTREKAREEAREQAREEAREQARELARTESRKALAALLEAQKVGRG